LIKSDTDPVYRFAVFFHEHGNKRVIPLLEFGQHFYSMVSKTSGGPSESGLVDPFNLLARHILMVTLTVWVATVSQDTVDEALQVRDVEMFAQPSVTRYLLLS
jgi:hypothetical protein